MVAPALSVVVVDANRIRASIIEEGLREAGCGRVTVISEIDGIVQRVAEVDPDVVVIDLEDPNRDALEHMLAVPRALRRPVAMFVDHSDTAMIEAAVAAGVSAYSVDGLKKERVKPILDLAIGRFNAFAKLQDELDRTKQQLQDRKIIDRAKGILMRRGLSESEAYARLRRAAMNENRRLADVAQSVVTAASLLGETS